MKMLHLTLLLSLFVLLPVALNSCTKSAASSMPEPQPENSAQFRKGEGLTLTAEMKHSIHLQIVEVAEAKVAAVCTVMLQVVPASDLQPVLMTKDSMISALATGWIATEQAAWIKPGRQVEVRAENEDASIQVGVVTRLEKVTYPTLGDYEVAVTTAAPLPSGTRLLTTFHAKAGAEVTAIPRTALLKTAEGFFAYTVNGHAYLRTPVKVGAMNEQLVEITDGLYAGDEIVASPVMSLWLAELQVLRGGKSCTCGH